MAAEETPAAGTAQAPAGRDGKGAVEPAPSARPAPVAEQAAPESPDGEDNVHARIAALRAEADRLEDGVDDKDMVRMKVEEPHSELHFAGTVVGAEYTKVPRHMIARLEQAAADAGVTLTTEG